MSSEIGTLKGKTTFFTGGSAFIGNHLCKALEDSGVMAYALSRKEGAFEKDESNVSCECLCSMIDQHSPLSEERSRTMSCFSGKHVVVTGASSGIGRSVALKFAQEGASLCIVSRHRGRLEAVAKAAIEASGGQQVDVCQQDLTREGAAARIAKRVRQAAGRVDALVHSAGTITHSAMRHATLADLDGQFKTNVRAPFALTKALLPMLCSCQGQIVFINSSIVGRAQAGTGTYAATKHALKGLADSLREEVNDEGVRVLSAFPGQTATPMQKKLYEAKGRTYRPERLLQPEDVASVVAHALSLPRTAEVTDLSIRPMMKP